MTTSPSGEDHLLSRAAAGLLLCAAVLGVPVALWELGRTYLPDRVASWAQVTGMLSGPDTGSVFLGLLVIIGWVAWAIFTLSVAVELAAQLGGLPPVRLPGLGGPQRLAGVLVAAVVGVSGAPLLVAPALAGPPPIAEQPFQHVDPPPETASAVEQPPPTANGVPYTVQPRDTLGRIAARYLGDWTRFEEILERNRGRLQPDGGVLTDPGLIRPGWVLLLPADAGLPAVAAALGSVTVQVGDTLSDIAAEHGVDGWQPIFDLNAGEQQPGGGAFTDPDVLRPGQVLDLPQREQTPPTDPAPPTEAPPPVDEVPRSEPSNPSAPAPHGTPTQDRPERPEPSDAAAGAAGQQATDADADHGPGDLVVVLSGSGALLAAGLGAAWLAHRRQRLRRRRPGRRLAPLPTDLAATQSAVQTGADSGQPDYAALDRALRALAVAVSDQPGARLPDVLAARVGEDRLDLRLRHPADQPPPAPWTADPAGLWWFLDLSKDTGVDPHRAAARLAPYPTLVTLASDEGRRWLVDLECVGVLRVSGSADRCEQFARHVAAELAVNSWSDLLTVTPVGFGAELADFAPERIHPLDQSFDDRLHAVFRDALRASEVDVLQGWLHAETGEGWMPTVVLGPHLEGDSDGELADLIERIDEQDARCSIGLLLSAGPTSPRASWVLTLTDDGDLLVPDLDLRLPAPRLTAQQALDIAALLAFERDAGDEPMPAAHGDQTWQASTDAAGALREDLTLPRSAGAEEGTGPSSAVHAHWVPVAAGSPLPHPTHAYTETSPASAEEVEVLGRRAPAELRRRVEADLDQLDHDLADWWAPECARPRLTLLGPVSLRAHGDEAAVTKSGLRRRYEEAVAYLATRAHGATVDEAATALQPARGGRTDPVSARAYVHRVTAGARAWLGVDPVTGEKHLSSGHRGPYTLTNVLVDADLFRQLRARAGVRGSEGMPDLLAALDLVTGPPFAQRPAGYEWLNGLDLTYTAAICDVAHLVITAAICDVAHLVITAALAEDDIDAARTASATALLVAPDDEKVLLDAMWVAYREGNRAEAETYVSRIVEVHDGDDEMDLPMSTAETINRARRQYLDRAS